MIKEVVSRAKYLQDQKNIELTSFQPDILKFQQELVESFKTFINLAKESEITGVNFEKMKDLGKGTREFCFQVPEEYLVLVMRSEIYPIDFKEEKLGNLSYLYFDGSEKDPPIIEISIYKDSSNLKFCEVFWFSTEGKKPLTGKIRLDENPGERAAEKILRSLYDQSRYWRNKPSREDFSSNNSKKGNLGFLE